MPLKPKYEKWLTVNSVDERWLWLALMKEADPKYNALE
jgi:hypothetical protein